MKKRLDSIIFERKLARSRTHAAELIAQGRAKVNGTIASKASQLVSEDDLIEVDAADRYVGRGGEKLEHALDAFGIDTSDKIAIDVGSSTGGFTECLLRRGAKKVYAIDVGTDQLDSSIKADPRVFVMEGTDIRDVAPTSLTPEPTLAVIDVSFISLSKILAHVHSLLPSDGEAIVLVKPQFEVGKEKIKKGVVRDEEEQLRALDDAKRYAHDAGFSVANETLSPITGKHGNKEFFIHLKK